MKLRKWLYSSLFSLISAITMLTQVQVANAATSGAYISSSVGQTIYAKNVYDYNNFPIVGTHPATGKITTVRYSWSFSYTPANLNVWLCQGSTNACINVTGSQNGISTAFANRSPTSPFFLIYWVTGSGTMSPAYSNSDQIVVNYNY